MGETEAKKMLDYVCRHSVILPLDFAQAEKGGRLAETERLALADAIIYSYSTNEENLLTGDDHFKSKKNVCFVK